MKDKAKKILILGSIILITIIIIISAIIIINSKRNQAEEKVKNISDYTIHNKLPEDDNQNSENSIIVGLQEEEIKVEVSTDNKEATTVVKKEVQTLKDNVVIEKNNEQTKQEQISETTDKKVTESKKENNKSENPSETVITEKQKEDNSKPIENTNSNKNEEKIEENKNENDNNNNNDVNNSNNNKNENNNGNNDANNTDHNKNENINTDSNDNNTDQNEENNNTETKVIETFEYNDNMTKQIKSIIEANESEYMKKYGYNVTIDGTIVNLTNQFTFTEDRVIDSLKYKFNTIRVYARDYYVNGVYMWTECFII